MKEFAGVLVHGYDINQPNWEEVMWGRPEQGLMGRIPKGIQIAVQSQAELIFFGAGQKCPCLTTQAEAIKYFIANPYELRKFSTFKEISVGWLSCHLHRVVFISGQGENTEKETRLALNLFKERGLKIVYIVTSPDHLPRAIRDAYAVCEEDPDLWFFTKNLFGAPSQVSYISKPVRGVQIIEPR